MPLTLTVRIGALFFHGSTGRINVIRNQGETFSRLGQTGSGSQILASRAQQSRISCWRLFDTVSNAQDFGDDVEDLCYTVVSSADPTNGSIDRLRITEADVIVKPGRGGDGVTRFGALLTANLTVEPLV
jgi:hypothetical protein